MMMMMTIKRVLFISIFSVLTGVIFSQAKDFGIWYGVSAEHKLIKNLEVDFSTCIRTFDNASKIEEAFFDVGLTYKFNKYLAAGGSYRLTENIENDDSYHLQHKWFFDVKGSFSLENFSFSGRFRLQERFKTYFKDAEDKVPDFHGRYRLTALYNIPSFPVNPYISAEIFCPMFKDSERRIDKNRFIGGFEYKIVKKHTLEAEYIFQRDYLPHISNMNLISINYNIKF
jgi:hypothetical protein